MREWQNYQSVKTSLTTLKPHDFFFSLFMTEKRIKLKGKAMVKNQFLIQFIQFKNESIQSSTSGFHFIHIQLTCHSQVERFERFIFCSSIFFLRFLFSSYPRGEKCSFIAPQQHKFHLHVYVISFTDKACLAALLAGSTLAILKKSLFSANSKSIW